MTSPATANDPVVTAVCRLGESAAQLLRDPDSWQAMSYWETWSRDPSDATRWFASRPSDRNLKPKVLFDLAKTDAWAAAVAAIKADKILGRVADRTVGDGMVAVGVQSFGLVAAGLQVWAGGPRGHDRLARVVSNWRSQYSQQYIDVASLTVVAGLSVARKVRLSDSVFLRQMTESEVAGALSVGMIAPMLRFAGEVFLDTPACLAFSRRMQLRVGEGFDKPAAAAYKRELEANEQAAVVALRLRGFDQVHVGPRIRQLFAGGVSWEGNPLTRTSVMQRAVEGGDARALRGTFTRALSELQSEGGLAVALRRFSGSFEPRHEQDRFLDLWIAMESLFGTEASNEVTFRLSLNAANFAITKGSRRDVFDWVQRCYRIRSKLVHGGRVSPGKVKRLSGEPAGRINDLSDDLLSIVGSALRRRLSEPADPDWVHLALRR